MITLALWLMVSLIARNVGAVSASASVFEANLLAILPRSRPAGPAAPQSLGQLMDEIQLDVLIRSISATLACFVGSIGLVGALRRLHAARAGDLRPQDRRVVPTPGRAAGARALGHIEQRMERYLWIKTLMSLPPPSCPGRRSRDRLPERELLGAVVFMLNYIPVIGSLIGVLFPSLLVLVQFGSFGPFFAAVLGLGGIQFGMGNVLDPRLMGSSLNLSPLAIIVALAVWGGLWGVAGMFLCVPITVIVMIVCAQFEGTRPLAVLLSADGRLDLGEPDTPAS